MLRILVIVSFALLVGCGGSKSYCELANELYAYCFSGHQMDAEDRAECEEQVAETSAECAELYRAMAECYVDKQVCNEYRANEQCGETLAAVEANPACS